MRIDKFLKVSRIIKRRTLANEICDRGRVMVNGRVVKAGHEVAVGDKLTVTFPSGPFEVIIEEVRENVPAKDAESLYRKV